MTREFTDEQGVTWAVEPTSYRMDYGVRGERGDFVSTGANHYVRFTTAGRPEVIGRLGSPLAGASEDDLRTAHREGLAKASVRKPGS